MNPNIVLISTIIVYCTYSFNPESPCNEQGIVYRESNFTVCNCFNCFYGEQCESLNESCIVDARTGNPIVYNEYWQLQQDNKSEEVIIDPYYRTGYQDGSNLYPPSNIPISKQNGINYYLREAILNIHRVIGNINPDNKYIIIGTGATQLINAVIYAISKYENKPVTVFAQTPYYGQYHDFAMFNPAISSWNASYDQQDNEDLVEFVTCPNNPTGEMRQRYYTKNKYTVYDMVYNWPSIAENMTENFDADIMLYSMSKLTGNAGNVKNESFCF